MISEAASAFGKYVLIERLAAGRSGEIFLARVRGPQGFKKLCAVKRVRRDSDAATSGTFVDEASITASLTHPHIAQVYEMGEVDRWLYMTAEYVPGKSLREVLSHAPRGLAREHTVELFIQLCSALGAAHRQGIVHREVEPSNILVTYSGEVKLVDFGSAASDGSDRTQLDAVASRVPYMSPEQNAAKAVDARTDVFSAGVCLYEALTGKNPFLRRNPVEAMTAIRDLNPPPVSRNDKSLRVLDAVVAKALAKRRRDRYPDCNAMAEALRDVWRTFDGSPPFSKNMAEWFADAITDEEYLASVALADADTGAGRRPTNVDKRALVDRSKLVGGIAVAFAVAIVTTALVTRAIVNSSDVDSAAQLVASAASAPVAPKLSEMVVKSTPPAPPLEQPLTPTTTREPAQTRTAATPAPVHAPAPQTSTGQASAPRPTIIPLSPIEAPPRPKPVNRPLPAASATEDRPAKKVETKPQKPAPEVAHDWTKDPTPPVVDDEDDDE